MKIRAIVTVEVDQQEWMTAAYCERAEVRSNVISYIREQLQGSAMFLEDTDAEVTVKPAAEGRAS